MLEATISGGLVDGLSGVDKGLEGVLPGMKSNIQLSLDVAAGIKLRAAASNPGCRAAERSSRMAEAVGCDDFCRHDGGLIKAGLTGTVEIGLLGIKPDPFDIYGPWEADASACVAAGELPPCGGGGGGTDPPGACAAGAGQGCRAVLGRARLRSCAPGRCRPPRHSLPRPRQAAPSPAASAFAAPRTAWCT